MTIIGLGVVIISIFIWSLFFCESKGPIKGGQTRVLWILMIQPNC